MERSPVFQHLSRLTKGEVLKALQELERERAELAAREAALRAVLPFAQGDIMDSDHPPNISGRRSLRETLLAILASAPQQRWTTDDLFQALRDRSALPRGSNPRTQMTNRLRTMRRDGVVIHHENGSYTLASEELRSAPASGAGNAQ